MLNWYDALNDLEHHPAFIEKMAGDDECEPNTAVSTTGRRERHDCSWMEKRSYKKRLVRRFLSINLAMDYSRFYGTRCRPGIYIAWLPWDDDSDYYQTDYEINPYSKIFLSRRGDLRKYRGVIKGGINGYALAGKDKLASRITNRRIRYCPISTETTCSYAFEKKRHAPLPVDPW